MRINAYEIPHSEHETDTIGDWKFEDELLTIEISNLRNKRYFYLIAVHEIIEAILCEDRGIAEEEVTAFDVAFEKERDKALHSIFDEPGGDKNSPYHAEHNFATKVEKMLAKELGIDWRKYCEELVGICI